MVVMLLLQDSLEESGLRSRAVPKRHVAGRSPRDGNV